MFLYRIWPAWVVPALNEGYTDWPEYCDAYVGAATDILYFIFGLPKLLPANAGANSTLYMPGLDGAVIEKLKLPLDPGATLEGLTATTLPLEIQDVCLN